SRQQVHKSGFTCSAWTDNGDDLAVPDFERNSVQRSLACVISKTYIFKFDGIPTARGRCLAGVPLCFERQDFEYAVGRAKCLLKGVVDTAYPPHGIVKFNQRDDESHE